MSLISHPIRVWNFLRDNGVPASLTSDSKGLGFERDGEILAGALYQDWSGPNVWVHLAIRRMSREFLHYGFRYPFLELGCQRLTGAVEASNAAARRFNEHVGFAVEATLSGAARDGGDVLIYVMWRDRCRFL